MQAIEFQTTVKNGVIEIPREHRGRIAGRVRVILLVEEPSERKADFIDHLLAHPIPVADFRPLKREEIYAR